LRIIKIAAKIRASDWDAFKFALNVDGHTNAWSNFFRPAADGGCLLKIQSVRADMCDLMEKMEWCRSHDAECAEIARNGQALRTL